MIVDLVKGNSLPIGIQTYGAKDTAEDQRRKVSQSNKHGSEIYSFIENLGGAFEEYHRDPKVKYPETNQFAFSDELQIRNDAELNDYLIDLINSGVIIRKQNRQLKSVGKPRGYIYQLSRIFAPLYQFSYRTRGGYNQMISTDMFKKMLKEEIPPIYFLKNGIEDESQLNVNVDENTGDNKDEIDYQFTIADYIEGGKYGGGNGDL
jgi:hypothetical protein